MCSIAVVVLAFSTHHNADSLLIVLRSLLVPLIDTALPVVISACSQLSRPAFTRQISSVLVGIVIESLCEFTSCAHGTTWCAWCHVDGTTWCGWCHVDRCGVS
jgi:hypothetical protein